MALLYSTKPTDSRGPNWLRVNRNRRCPVCDHVDWCLWSVDGTAAICARIEVGSVKRVGEAGWLHHLVDVRGHHWQGPKVRTVYIASRPTPQFGELARTFFEALSPQSREKLAARLGVSGSSLERLRVGWSVKHWAYSFPMCNEHGVVTGIRLRKPGGGKFSVKGGHEGLFIPAALPTTGLLLVTEGPTDCSAMLTAGFSAVGRPSCTGGVQIITAFIRAQNFSEVVVLADADAPGQAGAKSLAGNLRVYHRSIQILTPPVGVKDAREWVRAGATHEDMQRAIDAAQFLPSPSVRGVLL